jgi:hypothetical protein
MILFPLFQLLLPSVRRGRALTSPCTSSSWGTPSWSSTPRPPSWSTSRETPTRKSSCKPSRWCWFCFYNIVFEGFKLDLSFSQFPPKQSMEKPKHLKLIRSQSYSLKFKKKNTYLNIWSKKRKICSIYLFLHFPVKVKTTWLWGITWNEKKYTFSNGKANCNQKIQSHLVD